MNVKKFPIGGVHLPEEKTLTNELSITNMTDPKAVAIPLKQHVGVSCRPIVEKGQSVSVGQCIGANNQGLSAKVHASISGRVSSIEERILEDEAPVLCVVIERDGNVSESNHVHESSSSSKSREISPERIREIVEYAGIVGLGGACFPTHVKLNPPKDKVIDTVIINGAECEPYITVDHRLMVEKPQSVFSGLDLIIKAVGAKRGIVACEINKPDALNVLEKEATNWEGLEAAALDTRYPHGAEKHLIKAVLGKEVPIKGLPMDIGVVVNNVQTAIAISDAVYSQTVLTSRVITVSGRGVSSPANLNVPIGASIQDAIDYCGGVTSKQYRVIMGGPMTGQKIDDLSIPVTKRASGIVVLKPGEYGESEVRPCIRCGKCVDVCPMYLSPNRIVAFVNKGMHDNAKDIDIMDCIECGACAYVCPSKRPLLQWIRQGKAVHS